MISNYVEISNDNALAVRGKDELYREALLQSAKFNKKFISDRKNRIPLIDSQTLIAQSNCALWNIEHLKQKPRSSTQVLRYKVKNWKKTNRCLFSSTVLKNEPSADSNLEATISSEINGEQQEVLKRSSPIEVHNWYEDSDFELENDTEKVSGRKNKSKKKIKAEDKQLHCDKCNAKYKTKQGLNYHYSNFHQTSSITAGNSYFDESTTNSIVGSIYEDGNSTSIPHTTH